MIINKIQIVKFHIVFTCMLVGVNVLTPPPIIYIFYIVNCMLEGVNGLTPPPIIYSTVYCVLYASRCEWTYSSSYNIFYIVYCMYASRCECRVLTPPPPLIYSILFTVC